MKKAETHSGFSLTTEQNDLLDSLEKEVDSYQEQEVFIRGDAARKDSADALKAYQDSPNIETLTAFREIALREEVCYTMRPLPPFGAPFHVTGLYDRMRIAHQAALKSYLAIRYRPALLAMIEPVIPVAKAAINQVIQDELAKHLEMFGKPANEAQFSSVAIGAAKSRLVGLEGLRALIITVSTASQAKELIAKFRATYPA